MKKIAIVAAIATTAAVAAPFNGFSLGGNLGAAFTKYKFNGSTEKKANFLMALFAGYTKSFDNVIAGSDFGFSYEKLTNHASDERNVFGMFISPRVGYKFNDSTAMYGALKLGVNKTPKGFKAAGFKSSSVAFTPTVGAEKALGNVSLRGELGYKFETVKNSTSGNLKKNAVVMTIGSSYSF